MSGTVTGIGAAGDNAAAPDYVFNEIPATWRVPGAYTEVRPNYSSIGLSAYPTRVLLFGQKLATGYANVNTVYQITSAPQAYQLFGPGSMLAMMAYHWFQANTTTPVYAIASDDATGAVKATATLTITGAAQASGTRAVYIAGRRVAVGVAVGDTVNTIATNTAAAINAAAGMPVVATVAANTVTLTAQQAGLCGNDIDVRVNYLAGDATPAGLVDSVIPMTGGATNPDITPLIAAIAADWFTDFVVGWDDAATLAILTPELARRYTALGKLDAHAWVGTAGTPGIIAAAGVAQNCQFMTFCGMTNLPSAPWELAAEAAGVGIFQLANDPSRQLRGLSLPGIKAPAAADRYTPTQQENMLLDGVSTFDVLSDGTVVIQRIITTYQISAAGVADAAWLDIMVPKTASRIRYDWAAYCELTYPRFKLARDGDVAAEYAPQVMTPRRMWGAWGARCQLYSRLGWIENTQATVAASAFEINASDRNRLDGVLQIMIIGNLIVLASALEFDV